MRFAFFGLGHQLAWKFDTKHTEPHSSPSQGWGKGWGAYPEAQACFFGPSATNPLTQGGRVSYSSPCRSMDVE